MARRANQEARRHALRAAAGRAISERGFTGVRLKDIAEQAGLAPASVLYYYPDVDVLIREAFLHAIERFSERRRAAAETMEDPRERLLETIRSGLPTGQDDQEVALLYQAAGFVRSDPALVAIVRQLTEGQVGLYRSILELGQAQGVFHLADTAPSIARNLVALEDAYGLYVIDVGLPLEEAVAAITSFANIATGGHLSSDID